MAENKTAETDADVYAFLHAFVESEQKRQDSLQLIALMREWSGCEPKMWGPSIIGFGSYHYRYASGHEGDAPMIGFSPRKAAISLYVFSQTEENRAMLAGLGKVTAGKACIYAKKLSDIHLPVLEKMCRDTIAYLHLHHQCACHPS
jgi:hypothetical protein